jgi:hypothetical protein
VSKVSELGASAIDQLELSPEVAEALKEVHAELAESYRESFLQMIEAITKQASALDRIQRTLEILVRNLEPSIAAQVPAALRVASAEEEPDVATALLVADPIGMGFTLSATGLAQALGASINDVSTLLKAFKLRGDGNYAVVVRQGGRSPTMVNYHPRTIERFRELMTSPPAGLDANQQAALKRVLRRMNSVTPPPSSDSAPAVHSTMNGQPDAPPPAAKHGTSSE